MPLHLPALVCLRPDCRAQGPSGVQPRSCTTPRGIGSDWICYRYHERLATTPAR